MKKIEDTTINNGGGLWDNVGLCDVLVNDLNNLQKTLVSGQYIQFCAIVTAMAQKLVNLKNGIQKERESADGKIEELKNMNDRLVEQITGLPVDKDGAENATN